MAGSWERLASVTLGSDASPLTTGTFTAKKYLKLEARVTQSSTGGTYLRFNNNSSGGKYAWRYGNHWNPNGNRGSDVTNQASRDQVQNLDSLAGGSYWVCDIVNIQGKEKLFYMKTQSSSATGADADLMTWEYAGKWASNDQITEIEFVKESGKNDFTAGSTITVWGSDDAALVYPNLTNGAIFEESDTGKHYMFDGTSAWNEIT